MIVDFVDWFKL